MPTTTRDNTQVVLGRLEQKIDILGDQVSDIKEKIYGNGHPGLVVDQERQNASIEKLLEYAQKNSANIEKLREETTGKFLQRNWRTLLTLAVAFFLILHSMLPADMSLWTWFSKFLGGG